MHQDSYHNYNSGYTGSKPRYQSYIDSRRQVRQQYNNDIFDPDVSQNEVYPSNAITGKRSYEESDEKIERKQVATATSAEKSRNEEQRDVPVQSVPIDTVKSIVQMIFGEMRRGNMAMDVNNDEKSISKTKGSPVKNKRIKTGTEGTVTFDNIPLYLLEKPCNRYCTASNGNKFKIILIKTKNHGRLPVPKWENDNRSQKALKAQARNNMNSRATVNRVAQMQLERQARENQATSNTVRDTENAAVVPHPNVNAENPMSTNETPAAVETNDHSEQMDVELNSNIEDGDHRNHNTSDTNDTVTDYMNSISSRTTSILLIGLSYNSLVRSQYIESNEDMNIRDCLDSNGRQIDQCVARDTYRCYVLEKTYTDVKVYTVNKCTDALCTCDNKNDPYNINSDVGTNQFLKLLRKKEWSFNEVYVDTIRMQKTYVEHNFGKNFFNNLLLLERNGILKKINGREGVIYLPFNPHFFHMVNSNDGIKAVFLVSYLKENEINLDNHKLSYSISCHDDFSSLNKNLSEENRHITTTKKKCLTMILDS